MRINVGMMRQRPQDSSHNLYVDKFDMKFDSMSYKNLI